MKPKSSFQTSIGKYLRIFAGFAIINIISMLFPIALEAATYYSRVATGTFTALATWSINRSGTPTNATALAAGDIFIIQTGNNITVATITAASVTIESGGTLTAAIATLNSPLTINSGGTLNLSTINALTMGTGGSVTNNGTISGTSGRLTMGANTLTNNGSFTLSNGRLTRTTGAVINSGSITFTANGQFTTSSSGPFTNEATGTFLVTPSTTVPTITLGTGNFVNNNTSASVDFATATVGLTGTTRSVGGFTTRGAVNPSNASGTITITGNINGAAFTKSGAGTINMGTGFTHTFTGTFALGTTGSVNGGSSTINLNLAGSALTGTSTVFNPGTGTVNFGANGAQTIGATGTLSFYNLSYSTSGAKTNAVAYNVAGTFTLQGSATAGTTNPTYTGTLYGLKYATSTNRNAGTEWPTPFGGSAGVTIETTGGTTITVAAAKTFNLDNPLIITTGTLISGANAFTLGGDFINTGTWTTTGDVTINEARVSQVIGTFSTTGLVSFTKASGTATFTGNIGGGAFTMNSAAGILNLGTGRTHTFTGAWTNTAGTLEGNTSTLNIGGTGSGTGVTFTAGTSTVNFNGAGAQNIPTFVSSTVYYNLNTATGSTKTLLGNTTVSNVLTVGPSSGFATGAFTLTLSGTGTPLVDNGTFTATAGGTVIYSGATANIAAESYANLQTSTAGVKTLVGNTTVATVLTVNSPSELVTGANTLTLTGTGTPLVNNGTFTATAGGTVIYSGATANIAAESYANLQTSTAGVKTLVGNTTVATVLTVNSPSTLQTGANTLTLTGTGTPLVDNGTFTASAGSTVIFSGATATVAGETYANLQVSTAGAKTLGANATVSGVLTINSGSTLALSTFTLTLSGTGTPLVNSGGTFTPATGTVIYSGATSNIAALSYYNLQTSTAGSKTLAGATTVSNILTINSPSTLDLSTFTINLSLTGTPLVNNGTIAGTGTVNFSGSGAQTVAGTTYPNLEFSGAGTKTIAAATTINVTTNWVVGSTTTMTTTAAADVGGNISGAGNITMGSGTINIAGNWTNNGTFTRGTGTVIYDGTSQSIGGLVYNNLQTSNSGVKTLAGGTTVANILTIGASTTLDLSSVTLTLSAAGTPLVNNGTFTCSTSTVSFSNAASTNIPALNYYNLTLTGGARVLANSGTIGIANIFTPGAGGFTVTGSTVNFNGMGAQTIPAFTFNDMVLSGSGAKTILTATAVTVNEININDGPELDLPGTAVINITKP
ncbi:MAG: hypothetical protein Q8S11_09625 [Daejeonella sp.]|uniref:beta strand repeat-containing protein n=1 Tax=Daejeonella sp. TaxID=2805397 RepID=UPI002735DEBD|nr:hypothetical protein [Daejeonella sp.]MDP3468580.1 hypothetical protein [Daejeonella sp.]